MIKHAKLIMEFKTWPVWIYHDGDLYDNPQPSDLPVSHNLKGKLLKLQTMLDETYDESYPPDSEFRTEKEKDEYFNLLGEVFKSLIFELDQEYEVSLKWGENELKSFDEYSKVRPKSFKLIPKKYPS